MLRVPLIEDGSSLKVAAPLDIGLLDQTVSDDVGVNPLTKTAADVFGTVVVGESEVHEEATRLKESR
jgi:hypothetical protein